MTSGNVSNIPMQAAPGVSGGVKPDVKGSFNFQNVMAKSYESAPASSAAAGVTGKEPSVKVEVPRTEARMEQKQNADAVSDAADVSETLEEFRDDVKEVLAEELDVTEEEITKAMEALGLTAADLMEPSNVMKLMAELTGCDSTVELLLDESVTGVMQKLDALVEGVLEQTNVSSVEEFSRLMEEQFAAEETISVTEAAVETQPAEPMTGFDEGVETEIVEVVSEEAEPQVKTAPQEEQAARITNDAEAETVRVSEEGFEEASKDGGNAGSFDEGEEQNMFEQPYEDRSSRLAEADGRRAAAHMPGEMMHPGMEQPVAQYQPVSNSIVMESGQVVDVERIIQQIVEATKVTLSNQSTSLEMLLNPEGLGKVYLQLTQQRGEVNARMAVENQAVKEAMEHQLVQFRENLNQQGIKVNSIEVSVGTHEFERNLEENMNHEQQMEEQRQKTRGNARRSRSIDLNHLDDLQGLMSEEETLVARMMKEQGNSVNYMA